MGEAHAAAHFRLSDGKVLFHSHVTSNRDGIVRPPLVLPEGAQVRKKTNQITPMITIASPVETVRSASTEGILDGRLLRPSEFPMAPRANWKGFLRLSLVTCPVALYPATSDTEKVSFNQINRKTGHRIKYAKVDADTGEEVANEDIMKGYKVDTDTYIEVSKEELDDLALESTRTIEIDEFVPRADIDRRYVIRHYYLVPDV